MSRAHVRAVLVDANGNLVAGQQVYIYRPGTTTAVIGNMYNAASGGSTVANPRTSDSTGVVEVWLEFPQLVDFVYTDAFGSHRISGETDDVSEPMTLIRYAAPWGNNSNDGLSWKTAKLDVLGAWDSLTTGGTIYFADQTYVDDANHDRGLWMLSYTDPAYNGGNPTLPGWRYADKTLHLIGASRNYATGNPEWAGKSRLLGGSATDPLKPQVWLSGAPEFVFENINFTGAAVPVRTGITSSNDKISSVALTTWRDCDFYSSGNFAGAGPTVEVGYAFWQRWERCFISAGAGNSTPLVSIANVSGTTYRFTVGFPHRMRVNDLFRIQGVPTSGYNGVWEVTNINSSTSVDADIGATPGATGSLASATFRHARSYRRAAIATDVQGADDGLFQYAWDGPPAPAVNSAVWMIEDCVFNGAGVSVAWNNLGLSGGVYLQGCVLEGDGVNYTAPMFHVRLPGGEQSSHELSMMHNRVESCQFADATPGLTDVMVRVDGRHTMDPGATLVIGGMHINNFLGPVTSVGGGWLSQPSSRIGVFGVAGHQMWGSPDTSRRAFPPTAARYVNYAPHSTSGWSAASGSATVTTGKRSPDGLTNAATFTAGSIAYKEIYRQNHTYSVGDWIVQGAWQRGGESTNSRVQWEEGGSSGFLMDKGGAGQGLECGKRRPIRDGGWEWVFGYGRVAAVGATNPSEYIMRLWVDGGDSIDYAYPVSIHIPASDALTEAEVYQLAVHLQTWPDFAPAGVNATVRGQKQLVQLYTKAGVVADGDFPAAPPDGTLAYDTTNHKLMVRDGGAWKSTGALT